MADGSEELPDDGVALPCLDDVSRVVFLEALAHGTLDTELVATQLSLPEDVMRAAVERLVELRLLREQSGGDRFVPVDPRAAASEVAASFERVVRSRRDTLSRTLDTVRSLAEQYDLATIPAADTGAVPGLELLRSTHAVRGRLADETERCRTEALTVQPGGARSRSTLSDALPRDLRMLERGVRMQILYQHTARASLTTQSYARAVTAAGAEVRTLGELTDRIIVFDRRIAFIPVREQPASPPGAAVITEPHLVGFLCSVCERMWHRATPFDPDTAGTYQAVPNGLRRALLRGLAAGMKDEVISRRLGMSVRTCRRHIADLLNELQVTSRFQAGMAATRLGWLDHLAEEPDGEPAEAE
jgi:DNA-binding CsgD family transcriptional regulator